MILIEIDLCISQSGLPLIELSTAYNIRFAAMLADGSIIGL